MTDSVQLRVPGRLAGKGRPRAALVGGRPRMYTPAATRTAETRVREAWRAAGEPFMGEGPLALELVICEQRPAAHWTSRGPLSAAGRRAPFPARKPDLDNQIKLVGDALNGCLWHNDAQLVEVHARKAWCEGPGVPEFTVVTCRMVGMVGSDLVVLGDAA